MEVSLNTDAKPATDDDTYINSDTETSDSSKPAEKFLKEHPSAKIVVVIDTHCLDRGFFVWKGESAADYSACSLEEVSKANFQPSSLCAPNNLHRFYATAFPKACSNTSPTQETLRPTRTSPSSSTCLVDHLLSKMLPVTRC
jgi:hypothetical protein